MVVAKWGCSVYEGPGVLTFGLVGVCRWKLKTHTHI